jgi:hypothetical protein
MKMFKAVAKLKIFERVSTPETVKIQIQKTNLDSGSRRRSGVEANLL